MHPTDRADDDCRFDELLPDAWPGNRRGLSALASRTDHRHADNTNERPVTATIGRQPPVATSP